MTAFRKETNSRLIFKSSERLQTLSGYKRNKTHTIPLHIQKAKKPASLRHNKDENQLLSSLAFAILPKFILEPNTHYSHKKFNVNEYWWEKNNPLSPEFRLFKYEQFIASKTLLQFHATEVSRAMFALTADVL